MGEPRARRGRLGRLPRAQRDPGRPTYAIARNELNDSEFCEPTFTADGRMLFVNMQEPGLTLAVTGPWERYLG
ncbi:DUF839 domain-containing protein [Micromonospora sp. Llam7]|uniref:DUF839 domain-containing protein n=1 Tax=Micromonospora tarapacensis TaxID=2835305 RepID=UPI001C833619|nr:DUF839 domain-containing protein [Micromonospora tarapacensis]MBX7266612.1 DUF839 domain-containing protein [Micromonospora tarapacensis]